VITVQCEIIAQLKKDAPHKNDVFLKQCVKLTQNCNNRSGHLKTKNTESLLLLQHHLGNCCRGPAVSVKSELLVASEKRGHFPLLIAYPMPV
jgi:hypothetical protein